MSERIRVAVAQMTSTDDVERNLEAAQRCVNRAKEDGASLLLLPEAFAFLGPEGAQLKVAESLSEGGPILSRCQAMAKSSGLELVFGGFWEKSSDASKVHNTALHLSVEGEIVSAYRKIHLFDVDLADGTHLVESESVVPGDELVVTPTAFGSLGLSICYDLRFPSLYRALVARGAIALAIPAAFTLTTGKEHWHVLLRARAIECQAYVLAAAQTGHHYGRRFSYGHALIADPWGTVLAECGEGEGVAVAWVDPDWVAQVRRQLPSLNHQVQLS